ncbi:hypothetical protein [Thalassoglobus polymorphus]|uniref:Uncharacterized protein n=1 Tax=Thalassoglobus polymorphus TaxID=2527994 RepID=A0A517QJK8_9PLAN|nr:hypothetical protein [Thalassoglobus polymorphus]QDT31826.1 hypothetical protein Mal48_10620 [Thalassoglobus polymorphus]
MKRFHHLSLSLALITAVSMTGCGKSQPSSNETMTTGPQATGEDGHEDHHHPTEGPHHGSLIELGAEEYHGEMVHDEKAETVTIYVLDSAAKAAVPIDATEITINVKHGEKGAQFKLAAQPDEGDPEGKSSRFVSSDKKLGEDLHDEQTEATLVLSIGGKSYRGKIAHDHDHEHDHAH